MKRNEYARRFKQGYEQARKYGVSQALGMKGAPVKSALAQFAHEYAALYITSGRSIDKYERVRKALNRAYKRKGYGEVVPKCWLGLEESRKIKGKFGFIPRRMLDRNPEGYSSGYHA